MSTIRLAGKWTALLVATALLGNPGWCAADEGRPQLVPQVGHAARITDMVASHDGRWLFTGSWDGTVQIRGRSTLELNAHQLDFESFEVAALSIAAVGRALPVSSRAPSSLGRTLPALGRSSAQHALELPMQVAPEVHACRL